MSSEAESSGGRSGPPAIAWLSWVWVTVPFLYGLIMLLTKVPALVGG